MLMPVKIVKNIQKYIVLFFYGISVYILEISLETTILTEQVSFF